jgi:enamine deaminase RidA (YjgF/YER057c/UK114 family)
MTARRVTSLPTPSGAAPLELVELGELFATSTIDGTAAGSDDPRAQIEAAFGNLAGLLSAANVSSGAVGLVTAGIADPNLTDLLQAPFTALFPDPAHRPVLRVNLGTPPPGQRMNLQVLGCAGHRPAPLAGGGRAPRAVRLGDLVFTAGIDGTVPATGLLPADPETQVRQAFANLAAIVTSAGGSWDDVLHVYVFFRDRKADQPLMHKIWQEIFPVHGLCPARKAINYAALAGTDTVLEFQLVANLGGQRRDFVLDNVRGHDTGTMGAAVGALFHSSGVSGDPPHGQGTLGDIHDQSRWAFAHMRSLVECAGGNLDGIAHVTIMTRDHADDEVVMSHWRETFPDPANRPTHYFNGLQLNSQRSELVQLHVIATV